jgi:GTP 3',8-cyclase
MSQIKSVPDSMQASPVADEGPAGAGALVDRLGRTHDSLRLSVTDRCNLRCLYCMPESTDDFQDAESLLSFQHVQRVVGVLASVGVSKVRFTGGEPTLRARLPELVAMIRGVEGITDLAMTTNGLRMVDLAVPLKEAGLQRVNISLDALSDEVFQRMARRDGLDRTLDGIAATLAAGFDEVRLNALAIRGLNEDQIVPLVEFARDRNLTMRFIEYMPLGGDRSWREDQVLTGSEARRIIERAIGPLTSIARPHPSQPSSDFGFVDGRGGVGFINPVTEPFCGACNRLRLTASGALRNCLFSHREWDLKPLLDAGAGDDALLASIHDCVLNKEPGHLISQPTFRQPDRPMYQIGG